MDILAIRDDDLSYWSDPDKIEQVYGDFFRLGVKVSFAAIPNSVRAFYRGVPEKYYMECRSEKAIGENKPLVHYIRDLIRANKAEIMLHGYNHTYGYQHDGGYIHFPYVAENRSELVKWVPECIHKSLVRMHDEIFRGRKYLERVFDCPVTIFVPPSNSVGKVVRDLSMDICSSTPTLFDRGIRRGLNVWLKQKRFRLINGYVFPGVNVIREHREITAISLAGGSGTRALTQTLNRILSEGFPAVLATHYWELLDDPELYERLRHTVEYVVNRGGKSVFVSEILNA